MKSKGLHKSPPTGRFAPSPSGDLHLGSLVAAVASYLNVKHQQGSWLLRFDDLDTPRVVKGSQDSILRTLEAYGFAWDNIIIQSQRLPLYGDALAQLMRDEQIYACDCTRSQILQRTHQSGIYDNHCRINPHPINTSHQHSLRMIAPHAMYHWYDAIQGAQSSALMTAGDFIVKRSDGIIAYHLACAIDDSETGISEVIRGADLLSATPYQQWIQQSLQRQTPLYAHHPLIQDKGGIKLSKASAAPALKTAEAAQNLYHVLTLLGQAPPDALAQEPLSTIWHWAINHWSLTAIPKRLTFSPC